MELTVHMTITVQGPQDPFRSPKVVQLPPPINLREEIWSSPTPEHLPGAPEAIAWGSVMSSLADSVNRVFIPPQLSVV